MDCGGDCAAKVADMTVVPGCRPEVIEADFALAQGAKLFDASFYFQSKDGIRDLTVTGVQTCALPISHYRWSPDSKWLTYTKLNAARFSAIYVHSLADGKSHRLTSGTTNDSDPVFDPKGRYLYFTSNRDFNLTFSAWEFNYVYTDPTRVYVGVLAADGPALFLPQSDEEKAAAPPPAAAEEKSAVAAATPAPGAEKKSSAVVVKIDPAGFENRVRAIPGSAGSYSTLSAVNNGVLY